MRLLGVLTHKGVNGDNQVHIIDIEKALHQEDLRTAIAMNKSNRLLDKIKMVYQLYPKIRNDFFANDETEDEEPLENLE